MYTYFVNKYLSSKQINFESSDSYNKYVELVIDQRNCVAYITNITNNYTNIIKNKKYININKCYHRIQQSITVRRRFLNKQQINNALIAAQQYIAQQVIQ